MFERFTDRARHVVVLAQEESRRLNHDYIGTEHVLLGLLAERDGLAARVLLETGVSLTEVREKVEEIIGRGGHHAPGGHIPFTPRAKKVLELSLREALQLRQDYIGTEHILLGVIREGEGVAAQVLAERGVELARLRSAVVAAVAGGVTEPMAGSRGRSPAAVEIMDAAATLAGRGPMGSHHLLEALVQAHDSLGGKVLAALQVDPVAVTTTIEELGLHGTTDMTPEEAAGAQTELRVEGEEVHVVLRDPDTVDLVRGLERGPGDPSLVGVWSALRSAIEDLHRASLPAEEPVGRSPSTLVQRVLESRRRRRNPPD
ncbi:MAG TPA: Clp protease N-terminal domain-containing protein [Euzebya sp.]|nr:Clp protease N-terminal domain-containing protein [Euzebya sp.]